MSDEFVIPSAEPAVSVSHYKRHLHGASTAHVGKVECDTYDIGAHGASTFVIGELVCKSTGHVGVSGASTLIISNLSQSAGAATVDIGGASTFRIDKGTLHQAKGVVHGASTGLCHCSCTESSDVEVKSWSTWKGC